MVYFVNLWSWISVKLLSVKLLFWWQIWIGQTNLEIVSSQTILILNSISHGRGITQVWTVNLIYGGLRNNFSKYLLNICMWADLNLIFSEQFRGLLFCKCCRTSFIQFAVNQSAIRFLPKLYVEGIKVQAQAGSDVMITILEWTGYTVSTRRSLHI